MEALLLWLQGVFDSPEAILCLIYFAIRLVYFLATIPKRRKDSTSATEQADELKDIYLATAQLYTLIKEDKKKNEESNKT